MVRFRFLPHSSNIDDAAMDLAARATTADFAILRRCDPHPDAMNWGKEKSSFHVKSHLLDTY